MAVSGQKLFKIASQINIGRDAIVDYLMSKGFAIANKATTVLTDEMVDLVIDKFSREIRTAEKQREKVERQRQVRRSILEQGDSVVLESFEETHQPAPLPIPSPPPPVASSVEVPEPEADELETVPEPISQPEAVVEAEAAIESAPPETEPPVEIISPEPEHPAEVQIGSEVPDKHVAVGSVIDLSVLDESKKKVADKQGKPKTKDKRKSDKDMIQGIPFEASDDVPAAPVVTKPEPEVIEMEEPQPAAEVAPPVPTEVPNADVDQPKKKRKRVAEVEYQAGQRPQLKGLTVVGKIDLTPTRPLKKDKPEKGKGKSDKTKVSLGDKLPAAGQFIATGRSSTQRRFTTPAALPAIARKDDKKKKKSAKGMRVTVSDSEIERKIRETLSGVDDTSSGMRRSAKQKRRLEREVREALRQEEQARMSTTLRLSEFVTTADLGNLMGVSAADIILKCMGLGLMVSINQRLDKETIILIAGDYGFEVEFLDDESVQDLEDDSDDPATLVPRHPIVTIMGHVDHGKTSLLDYIRSSSVVAGEAGGITQHIGAYQVEAGDRRITFLDTPGHEAFTAMRARGAQVTDIVVLVVAADDSVMPQTIEAISHAQAANVPIVVAINKIDRADSNPDRIRQQLTDQGILVEDWGGKYQVVELSAKTGKNVDLLLEKILLEADLLNLRANPDRTARGTVVEAHVDKGRGNVVTVINQKGTLSVGDIFVCGQFAGRVRAMFDERGNRVIDAGPSMPVQVTGFDGLPSAGDLLVEMKTDAEARDVAIRRQQLRREQQLRGMRHITLDEISARIAQGGVKELRLVVKADVSGSVEALTDSLLKLSTPEVQVRILYRAVGSITESDVMLAAASDAIVVGFQVTVPSAARKLAEAESVDIRLYSIIYDCIAEVQMALEGMLTPDIKEEITGTVEVRATFKVSRLGTIAGCYVQSGKINRNDKIRVLRDGFETFKGTISSLKRIKDDVREVDAGYECGLAVNGFNDIQVGDLVEAYRSIEIKRKLSSK